MISNLEEKTGKKMKEWISIVLKSGEDKHMAKVKFLKDKHGLTHGYANLIVHSSKDEGHHKTANDQADIVTAQYEKKSDLRPVYDMLVKKISAFGKDVEVSPKKAYVSLRRKKQFAILQPSTKTRLDVGINLKGKSANARLEASGSFNAMVSHRVRVSSTKEVDRQLISWIKEAYDSAG